MIANQRYAQEARRLAVTTPLGKDALLLRSLAGHESISQLFCFQLDLLSENDSIPFADIVGKPISVQILLPDGSPRFWNGFVSRFSQGARDGNLTVYRAEMVPWMWFLTRTTDCRMFQNKKVPDIIQQIFTDLNFQDYRMALYGDFIEREYCVQYRETDFAFVSRLMEEEGIYYFFEHVQDKHTLVLANDAAAHQACPNQASARYELTAGGWQEDDVITEWRQEQEFRPGCCALTDFNFETPSTDLRVNVAADNPYEVYDFPGEYRKRAEGDSLARIRLQQELAPGVVISGSSTCRDFTSGYKFELKEHYRADMNSMYLITSIRHRATLGGDYGTSSRNGTEEELSYSNTFECIPYTVQFRPQRTTPRPFVRGCQTAVVVGPGGEEIYTDKYGRVKVQFHWDREGKRDENSSCWIRVSHPWAGQGWGAVSIPRIGQEVIVDFVEGDPDQPIITGRVYNAECMPPYALPGGAVVSGLKSNSTKGGGGYNEIACDDTKGNELIRIHGQYDMDTTVEHDERVKVVNNRTENVGVDESITIGSNRTEKVGVNQKVEIGGNQTEDISGSETLSVTGDRKRSVGGAENVMVKLTRTHSILINDMLNVGAAQEVTVGGAQAITVGAARAKTVIGAEVVGIGGSQVIGVKGSQTVNIKGNRTQVIGKNRSERIVGNRNTVVLKDDGLKVSKKLTLNAGDQIVLSTGKASLTMKKDGTITINGKKITMAGSDVSLNASGKFVGKASGDMILKGQKIKQN